MNIRKKTLYINRFWIQMEIPSGPLQIRFLFCPHFKETAPLILMSGKTQARSRSVNTRFAIRRSTSLVFFVSTPMGSSETPKAIAFRVWDILN